VKVSGSVWFVYGVAVLVTFVIGVLAFGVFVLSKVFGSSSPEETPVPVVVQAQPSVTPTPVLKVSAAQVLEVRAVVADSRQFVVIVATPVGCARNLRAVTYAEGVGAVAVRVTQQTNPGCRWQRKPVLATAKTPIAARTLIINGTLWTRSPSSGTYHQALRTSTS
jgi:hypothetical protein